MITVFGATGNTGAPLVDTLLANGATVRAVTGNPARLDALKAKGCEAVVASFTEPAALARACDGAEKIYLVTPAHLDMRQWKANVIEAAKAAGVRHVVLATGLGASPKAGLTFGKWHSETQELLKQSGLDWTFVQPTYFMQNLFWQTSNIGKNGVYHDDLGGPGLRGEPAGSDRLLPELLPRGPHRRAGGLHHDRLPELRAAADLSPWP